MSEQEIQQRIRLACSRGDVRLWRNNVGALRDDRGRMVTYGLCKGSSDLIGYRTVEVTEEMVGKRVAVFVAVEVKGERGRASTEQEQFLAVVRDAGGYAAICRSVSDAEELLRE